VLILIAAVIPAAILVSAFAYRSFDEARATQIASLERDAESLLTRVDVVPAGALRMAVTLASFSDFALQHNPGCVENARAMIERYPAFSAFALLRGAAPGCSYNKEGTPSVAEIVAVSKPGGLDSGAAIGMATLPDGRFVLFAVAPSALPNASDVKVVLVVDDAYLESLLAGFRSMPSSSAVLADAAGRPVIVAGHRLDHSVWPSPPLPLSDKRATLALRSAAGQDIVYTSASLSSPKLWLLTAQPEADVLGWPRRQLVVTALAPLVIVLAAILAIWVGLNGSVLRWVSALAGATRAYSAGAMTSRVGNASAAPRELAELAASFDTLADRMAERTLDLEREVAAKTSYIREIHHRVKNNLQVIGSLLALQKRELAPDMRAVLRFPEDRVNAMSAAYRASYAVSEIGQVPIDNVVREVAHRLQASGEGRNVRFDLDTSGGDMEIDLDTAVSIAMLMAEILPAYADSSERTGSPVRIRLAATPHSLVLHVKGHPTTERQTFHLARRFIQAYLRQLNARLDESVSGETLVEAPFPRGAVKPN
jgi:two-component sensor histidine kinase